jgi:hypothetical protein
MQQHVGRILIYCGALLLFLGILIFFFGEKFSWFGHLPGDIRIERPTIKIYIPIATMILVSVILTLLINFLRKLF